MQETRVQFLGGEDPLETEMAICSCILARKTPWTVEPGRLQFMELQSQITEQLSNNNITSPSRAFLIYKMCTITIPALENHENLIR